ncbi:hypothetical protein GCM10011586_22440 [Silvibacterium dinghuense]|nr:hypothetical protein GCM10011586_22440 [Silvibacterium dinghuense]
MAICAGGWVLGAAAPAAAQVSMSAYVQSNGTAVFTAYPGMITEDNVIVVSVPSSVAGYPQGLLITGSGASYFQVDTSRAYQCPGGSGPFADGLDCQAPIYFSAPASPGTYTATATYSYEDSSGNIVSGAINLSGTVLALPAATGSHLSFLPAVSVIAGTGAQGYSGNNGPATSAELDRPSSVVADSKGNIYVADAQNFVVRRIDTSGNISIYAGTPQQGYPASQYSGEGGAATSAVLQEPVSLAIDSADNLYISDYPTAIRRVDAATGIITTYAGPVSYQLGYTGDGGAATSALFDQVGAIALDSKNNLYIADVDLGYVRKVDSSGTITAYAGQNFPLAYANKEPLPFLGYSGDGGPATSATLGYPEGLAVDAKGNLYIADTGSDRLRMVNAATQVISTVAGIGDIALGTSAQLAAQDLPASGAVIAPIAIAVDGSGNAYPIDFQGLIYKIDSSGTIAQFPSTSYTTRFGAGGYNAGATFLSDGRMIVTAQNINQVMAIGAQGALNFGNVNTGSTSSPMYLTIQNSGAAALDFSTTPYSVTGDFAVIGGGTCDFTEPLAAGSSCTVAMAFTPQVAGALTGTISFASNDPASPLVAQLSGIGVGAGTTSAALSIPDLAFPATEVGGTASLDETLTNTGTIQLNLSGITITGTNPAEFSLGSAGTCGATLAAGSHCTIEVRFTPQAASAYSATLNVAGNMTSSPLTAGMSGTGMVPVVLNIAETIHVTDADNMMPGVQLAVHEIVHVTDAISGLVPLQTPVLAWSTPLPIVYGTALGGTQLDAAAPVAGTFVYSPPAGTVLGAGSQTLKTAFAPQNTSLYRSATDAVTLLVKAAPLTLTANNASRAYGAPNPQFTGTITGVVNGDQIAEAFATTATATSAPGSYPILVLGITGTGIQNYTLSATNGTLTVTKANVQVQAHASSSISGDGSPVTLNAVVASTTTGTPTGTVTFYQGTTSLGNAALANGAASLQTSQLASGSDSVTASYSGDADFNSGASTAFTETVTTFSVSLSKQSMQVAAGSQAVLTLTASPVGGSFSNAIQLSVSGLPSGAVATFTPSSITPGANPASSTLEIQTANLGAANTFSFGMTARIALGLLLPFLLPRRMRCRLAGFTMLAFLAIALVLNGCGASQTTTSHTYPVTVTATSGQDVQSASFQLTVE